MLHQRFPIQRRLTINEVGRLCGLTHRALRIYEQRGLIEVERGPRGERYYDDTAIARLGFIAAARRGGLTLAEISRLLTAASLDRSCGAEQLRQACRRHLKAFDEAREALAQLASSGKELLDRAAATQAAF